MKVAFFNNSRAVSGGEEYLLDLARLIGQRGFEPVFFVHEEGVLNQKVRERGHKFQVVFSEKKMSVPLKIAQALRKEQPDIILVAREHNIYPVAAGYLLARPWLTRRPRLVNVFQTPTGRSYPLLTTIFDGVIATSEYTGASFFSKNPGLKEITRVIHYGVPVPTLQPDKHDRNRIRRVLTGKNFPIIGMVGELWKNQEELVDAGVRLCEVFPDITIAIVGGGDLKSLHQKIVSKGLENHFILTGRIPREQIPDLFYDFDLSVSTHRNEGFGIVHIESLAALTPVVAYNSGGLVEIVNKGGGVLVDGGTEEFTQAVIDLLRDDVRLRELGEEGRRVFEEYFNLDVMVTRHVEYFRGLVRE